MTPPMAPATERIRFARSLVPSRFLGLPLLLFALSCQSNPSAPPEQAPATEAEAKPVETRSKEAGAGAKRKALLHAAGFGDLANVQRLLSEGADPNARAKDPMGRTALILAAAGGHLEIVDALLAKGAKIEDRDRTGHTALNWAAMRGRTEVVSNLLGKGADINTQDNGGVSPLLYAVGTQNVAMVRILASHGPDMEVESRENKMTPLLLAVEHRDFESIRILLR